MPTTAIERSRRTIIGGLVACLGLARPRAKCVFAVALLRSPAKPGAGVSMGVVPARTNCSAICDNTPMPNPARVGLDQPGHARHVPRTRDRLRPCGTRRGLGRHQERSRQDRRESRSYTPRSGTSGWWSPSREQSRLIETAPVFSRIAGYVEEIQLQHWGPGQAR